MDIRYTQNFLHNSQLVSRIVKMAELADTVLEIGPGDGIITRELAKHAARVIAVELDAKLAGRLRDMPNVEIVQGDILQYDLASLPAGYSVFSNVPFNITSDLLEYLLNPHTGPLQAHLILQRDAILGDGTETFKSLLIKPLYTLESVHMFSRADFKPQPGVDTALFAFDKRPAPLVDPADYESYKDFLAFVSKDRVGEGTWKKLFSKAQLLRLDQLVAGRGLKSQSLEGIVAAFQTFMRLNQAKQGVIQGAMSRLRAEQQRRERINQAGGHHRSQKR